MKGKFAPTTEQCDKDACTGYGYNEPYILTEEIINPF